MLSNPKWLLFALIFFGGITIFGGIVDGLMYTPTVSVDWWNPLEAIKKIYDIFVWDYDWFPSSFALLKYILLIFSGVFVLLLAYEVLVAVRNFLRIF